MPLQLINRKEVPKDGFWITDPNTGRRFGGYYSFNYVSVEYLGFLKGNNLPNANIHYAHALLDQQTCLRDPSICYDASAQLAQQTSGGGCSGCGIRTT